LATTLQELNRRKLQSGWNQVHPTKEPENGQSGSATNNEQLFYSTAPGMALETEEFEASNGI
jgi:hypothetical protein